MFTFAEHFSLFFILLTMCGVGSIFIGGLMGDQGGGDLAHGKAAFVEAVCVLLASMMATNSLGIIYRYHENCEVIHRHANDD